MAATALGPKGESTPKDERISGEGNISHASRLPPGIVEMKMDLSEPRLWILKDGENRTVYDDRESAIGDLKDAMKEGREAELSLLDFNDKTISSVPWKEIATFLAGD